MKALPHCRVWEYELVTSTMDIAKSHLIELKPGEIGLVISETQTNGRGRLGHSWESPKGSLYATFIFKDLDSPIPKQALSLVVGISIVEALELDTNVIGLKWPNDLVTRSDKRKLCGILVESAINEDRVTYYIGIGLNVRSTSLASAVTLEDLAYKDLSLSSLATKITYSLENDFKEFLLNGFAPFKDRWRSLCMLQDHEIVVRNGEEITGLCKGISDDGALCIKVSSGIKKIYSGTVVRW